MNAFTLVGRLTTRSLLCSALLLLVDMFPGSAWSQNASENSEENEAAPETPGETSRVPLQQDIMLYAEQSNLLQGGGIAWNLDATSRFRLGLDVAGASARYWTTGGYATEDAFVGKVAAPLSWLVDHDRSERVTWRFEMTPLARLANSNEADAVSSSTVAGVELGLTLDARTRFGSWTGGVVAPVEFEVSPDFDLFRTGSLTRFGATFDLGERWAIVVRTEFGGLFGSNGDAPKWLAQGQVGLRATLGGDRDESAEEARPADTRDGERPRRVGVFAGSDWRLMRLAGHNSHGPGVQAGILLARGHLKLGVYAFGRPGPINPQTFELQLDEGNEWQGQDSVALRSDGAFAGIFVAPVIPLGRAPLTLEIPVAVGQAAYGFYLHDEDRVTPDGERTSVWEDELMDGADSGFAIGVETGATLAFHLPRTRIFQPYVGVRYQWAIGYDATLSDSYDGASVLAGVQVGTF
jgi:hypothetical protein